MPWKVNSIMDERVRFISRLLEGERMIDLCREFRISRKTGYKFRSRYMAQGVRGLVDMSHRPLYHPHQTPKEIEDVILDLRHAKPTWGPKKLKTKLEIKHPGLMIPATSTIGEILKRYRVPLRKRRRIRRVTEYTAPLRESHGPNDIWCVDYKGQFQLGNQQYCYPLTVTDHYSRFLIGCEALEGTSIQEAFPIFDILFREYGLPQVIRSDNGIPFASCGLNGWSQLSVWWLRLGIALERIQKGHPEQNGRHERFHWTLKNEATRPASFNILQQQERFDAFKEEYNTERPHEALNMQTPASLYSFSTRPYSLFLKDIAYPLHDLTRKVEDGGTVYISQNARFYLSLALTGENVGLREILPKQWLVTFIDHDLGCYNEDTKIFSQNIPSPQGITKMSPIIPV